MNAIRVTRQRYHCIRELNGHSNDVDCKSMFHIVYWYIFDYVLPPHNNADLVTPLIDLNKWFVS